MVLRRALDALVAPRVEGEDTEQRSIIRPSRLAHLIPQTFAGTTEVKFVIPMNSLRLKGVILLGVTLINAPENVWYNCLCNRSTKKFRNQDGEV